MTWELKGNRYLSCDLVCSMFFLFLKFTFELMLGDGMRF